MIEEFIIQIMNYLNKVDAGYSKAYYEEAAKDAIFPYVVVPTITISDLAAGDLIFFDIEIYNNELSNIRIESIIDILRTKLKGYIFNNEKIAFHVGFENGNIVKIQEQDLIGRKISFSARVFEKGE